MRNIAKTFLQILQISMSSAALCACVSSEISANAATPTDDANADSKIASSDAEKEWRNSFRNILILNEDNDRFFIHSPEMSVEALMAHIEELAGGVATHYFMCPNGQRTSYDSKVHEPIWAPVFGKEPTQKWAKNCKLLKDKGIDPYSVWIEACRKNKISPWITIRMNDVHFVTQPDYFRNQTFWREHPDLWRIPQTKLPTKGNWSDYAFNYKHKTVRDFHLALVHELFERYDFDGFELDWLRFGRHLTPKNERNESQYITEFTREVKKIAKQWEAKRGHKIGISARVHATPELAIDNGFNVSEWVREGLVDLIVPSCRYNSGDFSISVRQWKKYLGDSAEKVAIIPSTDNGFTPSNKVKRKPIDMPLLDGWATAMRSSGAESLYLFNPFYQPELLRQTLARGLTEKISRDAPRRHPVTFRDMGTDDKSREIQLPFITDMPHEVRIVFGRKPSKIAQGKLSVVVAFSQIKDIGRLEEAKLLVKLNGADSISSEEVEDPKNFGDAERALRFFFNYSALKSGINKVTVESLSKDPQKVVWIEIDTNPPAKN